MNQQHSSTLQIPLYKLLYVQDVTNRPLSTRELEQFSKDYEPCEIKKIVEALKWASARPKFPYSSLVSGIKFSDEECHQYLVNVLSQIEQFNESDGNGA